MPIQNLHTPERGDAERLLLIGSFPQDFVEALRQLEIHLDQVLDGKEALDGVSHYRFGVAICSLRTVSSSSAVQKQG